MKSEQFLIRHAQQGDHDAFGQLVRRFQDRLFTSMAHLVGQSDEAEDIVQDTMVQAYTKLSTFKGNSSFYTWIYRIALNIAADRRRQRKPEQSLSLPEHGVRHEPVDSGETPAARLQRLERADHVRVALARLNEEFRQILIMREVDDFDYATIAGLLQISVGTVRSRLHRARAALRAALEHPTVL